MTTLAICAVVFFFNDTATTEIYTLSLHDALPISVHRYGHTNEKKRRITRPSNARPNISSSWLIWAPTTARSGWAPDAAPGFSVISLMLALRVQSDGVTGVHP